MFGGQFRPTKHNFTDKYDLKVDENNLYFLIRSGSKIAFQLILEGESS